MRTRTYKLLDHGYVSLIETWGSDERIVEAARMSTGKGFVGWGPLPCGCVATPKSHAIDCPKCGGTGTVPGDEKFLKFLWENKHHSPFEMAGMTIEVQAPIFVFREWHRHRTQSYNEMSARYTPLPDLCYLPSIRRLITGKQSTKNKQSSAEGFTVSDAEAIQGVLSSAYNKARETYEELLEVGVARELARLVVPVAQYSRMRASANLRNWLAFLTLRKAAGAQQEIREYASAVADLIDQAFPRTYALFTATPAGT